MNTGKLKFSSIAKKITAAVTGSFLIIFLLVHLGINLFLLPLHDQHKEWFTAAAHFMGTNWIVKAFEVVLMLAFLMHAAIGLILQLENWRARGPQSYKISGKTPTSFLSKYIVYTGLAILGFLILHFYHFYFIKLGIREAPLAANIPYPQEEHFYELSVYLFSSDYIYSVIYLISFVFLGFHLNHAFQSAFQTFGLNNPRYFPFIKKLSTLYAIIIPAGFASIPIYFIFS